MDKPSGQANVSNEEFLALAHVRAVKAFYLHAAQFVVVVGIMAVVNFAAYPQYLWVKWVALGWGSGVLIHGLQVFGKVPFLTVDWEKRQVEKYLGRKL
jgi:hypothetical protein